MTTRKAALAILAALALLSVPAYRLLRSEPGGPTADAIANQIDKECPVKRTEKEPDSGDFFDPRFTARANQAIIITCDGEVSPISVLRRFSSPQEMRNAIQRFPVHDVCILEKEVFSLAFTGYGHVCRDLGGTIR